MTDGYLIVLTGATRGLGRAMTAEFIKRGHTVFGCGTSPEHVEALNKSCGLPHAFSVVDVACGKSVKKWAEKLLYQSGPPRLLINNAGVINRNERLWEVREEDFARVMDVNVKGTANVIRAFLPAMIKRRQGMVVNFSSGWGRSAAPEVAPYCASKWAVEGLTQALAQELPSGMGVVALNPGMINTSMLKSCFGKEAEDHPAPDEWAAGAVSCILTLGPQHNGQALSVP